MSWTRSRFSYALLGPELLENASSERGQLQTFAGTHVENSPESIFARVDSVRQVPETLFGQGAIFQLQADFKKSRKPDAVSRVAARFGQFGGRPKTWVQTRRVWVQTPLRSAAAGSCERQHKKIIWLSKRNNNEKTDAICKIISSSKGYAVRGKIFK